MSFYDCLFQREESPGQCSQDKAICREDIHNDEAVESVVLCQRAAVNDLLDCALRNVESQKRRVTDAKETKRGSDEDHQRGLDGLVPLELPVWMHDVRKEPVVHCIEVCSSSEKPMEILIEKVVSSDNFDLVNEPNHKNAEGNPEKSDEFPPEFLFVPVQVTIMDEGKVKDHQPIGCRMEDVSSRPSKALIAIMNVDVRADPGRSSILKDNFEDLRNGDPEHDLDVNQKGKELVVRQNHVGKYPNERDFVSQKS